MSTSFALLRSIGDVHVVDLVLVPEDVLIHLGSS